MMREEKIKQIADHYGLELQLLKLSEEAAELIKEVSKTLLQRSPNDVNNRKLSASLLWEMADVELMLAQIKYLASAEETINDMIRSKSDRQLERIGKEVV